MSVLRLVERRRPIAPAFAAFLILGLSLQTAPLARAAPLEAALGTASDLALAAAGRLNRRIEAVRDPGVTAMSGVDLDIRIDRTQADRSLDPFLADPETDRPVLLWDNDFEGRPAPPAELEVRRQATSDGSGDLWGSGLIEFGRDGDGMIASRRSRADLATGLDLSLSDRSTAGFAAGFNRAHEDGAGTLDLPSFSAYGTFAPTPGSFVDLTAGAGPLNSSGGAAGSALASGASAFATATYGARTRVGGVVLSPYGRMESVVVRAVPRLAIGRDALLASRTSAVAGLKTVRPIQRPDYALAPALRLEMRQDLAQAQSLGRRTSQQLTVAPEIAADLGSHWTARVEHLSRFGGDGDTRSLQFRFETKF